MGALTEERDLHGKACNGFYLRKGEHLRENFHRVLTFDLGFTEPTGICLADREGSRQADVAGARPSGAAVFTDPEVVDGC